MWHLVTIWIIIIITIIIIKNRPTVHRKSNVDDKNTKVTIAIILVNSFSSLLPSTHSCISDVRQEAVKQALEQFGARPIPSSKRIVNTQTKRTNIPFILHITHLRLGDSTDDDEDDDDESSSTYAPTMDEQHNKESSISPIPTSFQNHHYQNPPTVESILKSNQTIEILFVRAT